LGEIKKTGEIERKREVGIATAARYLWDDSAKAMDEALRGLLDAKETRLVVKHLL